MDIALDTGIKIIRNVPNVSFGRGSLNQLGSVVSRFTSSPSKSGVLIIADHFFEDRLPDPVGQLIDSDASVIYIDTTNEPTTDGIDGLVDLVRNSLGSPELIVGFGGGAALDSAKALSNLLTNGGRAADFQGWDLVRVPGVPKIGIPTLSGTGAEATRTCVMTNPQNGIKLGMNSDHTVFDFILLDADLTATASRDQYFYTGMDAYIHCVEALSGSYRNAIGDALSREALHLCESVFTAEDMMSDHAREELMVASYLGGCAIATTYVGLVHPFSAALSVVLGLHHCVANCVALMALEDYYVQAAENVRRWSEAQNVSIPSGFGKSLSEKEYVELEQATLIHDKPLTNALGPDFRNVLSTEKVRHIFEGM